MCASQPWHLLCLSNCCLINYYRDNRISSQCALCTIPRMSCGGAEETVASPHLEYPWSILAN